MAPETRRPSISVVMGTLNCARFIGEQLDSIAAQTVLPAELVVGEEGSEDATLEIVERFAARAPFPVVVVRNPRRLGFAENFLSLATRAHGPIVALSDCDDVWNPHKLERVVPWFDDPAVGLVVHRAEVVDESLRPLGRRYPIIRRTVVRRARRIDPWFSGTGMGVFRKALLEAVAAHADERPPEAGGHGMDHDDWIYLLSGSLGSTVFLAEDLALYRQHGGSAMGAPGGPTRERVDRALSFGAGHFRRQTAMFDARRAFWLRVARDAATPPGVRAEAEQSATWNQRLAKRSRDRASVRNDADGRARRLLRLLRLATSGGYLPRTMGGLGGRALAADLVSLVRPGTPERSPDARHDLAARVSAARAEGRSVHAVIADLSREGVTPLYGSRWTEEMIRDLVFQARRGTGLGASDATNEDEATVTR